MKRKKVHVFLLVCAIFLNVLAPPATVQAAPEPRLNIKKLDMTLGTTFQLQIYNIRKKHNVIFKSKDESIVRIVPTSENERCALLQAQAIGKTVVKAIVRLPKKKKIVLRCKVNVTPQAVSIKFVKKKLFIPVGSKRRADIIVKPSSSTERPIYESSDPSIVTINPLGWVTAISPGVATIQATSLFTRQITSCTVIVQPPGSKESTEKTQKKYTRTDNRAFALSN